MLNSEFTSVEETILEAVGEGFGAKPGISVDEVESRENEKEEDDLDDDEEEEEEDDEEEEEEEEISTW